MKQKLDCVICARNEEKFIEDVVRVALESPQVSQVIVVDDKSTDLTAEVARNAGAVVVPGPGKGKGQATEAGMLWVTTDRVLLLDADTLGLGTNHLAYLCQDYNGMILGEDDCGDSVLTGERSVPSWMCRELDLDGFYQEVMMYAAAQMLGMPIKIGRLEGSLDGKGEDGSLYIKEMRPLADQWHSYMTDWGRRILPGVMERHGKEYTPALFYVPLDPWVIR